MKDICIIPRPQNVSWTQIKECLMISHESNRSKGIHMSHYLWSAEKIGEFVEESGVMFVALDGEKVVGTLGIKEKIGNYWFIKGRYAYLCFGSMLPDYRGYGVYKALNKACEEYAAKNHLNVLVLDTHCKNRHMQDISKKGGYRFIRFFQSRNKDHYCVAMAKWLDSCPFSSFYCKLRYYSSWMITLVKARCFR